MGVFVHRSRSGVPLALVALVLAACSGEFGEPRTTHVDLVDSADTAAPDTADTSDTSPDTDTDEGPNLLRNGGFEGGEGSFAGVAPSWEPVDGKAHAEDYLETRDPYAEQQSQCIATGGAVDVGTIVQKTGAGTVEAGQRVRMHGMVRTDDVASASGWYVLGIWWYQDAAWLGEARMDPPSYLNYEWTEITFEGEAPEGTNQAAAVLTAHTDGTACYDELVLAVLGG